MILGLGLVIPLLYAFPGVMSQDSFDILIEARAGVFTDGHPPINAALWRVVDYFVAGPFAMLLIQLVSLLVGLYLIMRRTFAPQRAAWIAGALLLFPPILSPLCMIWKDCLMAGMFALGIGCVMSERRGVRLAGLAAFFLATACRYNAAPAVLVAVVLLFEWRPGLRALHRYAIAIVAWLVLTAAAFGINSALTDRQMYFWHSTLAVFDIAGVLANIDEDYTDPEMERLLAGTEPLVHTNIHAHVRDHYDARDFIALTAPDGKPMWNLPLYGEPAPAAQRAAIEALWWKLVVEHKGAYLAHRIAVMRELVCLGREPKPIGAIPRRIPPFPQIAVNLGVSVKLSPIQRRITHVLRGVWEHVPIFAPWIYIVIAIVLLWPARRERDVLALLLGALGLEATLPVLGMSPDYRYSHWLIVATCISTIILVARRSRKRSRDQVVA